MENIDVSVIETIDVTISGGMVIVKPEIPPTTITDAEYLQLLNDRKNSLVVNRQQANDQLDAIDTAISLVDAKIAAVPAQ